MTGSTPICGAKTRKGHACTLPAGWATDHEGFGNCKHHGGSTPTGKKSGARKALAAEAVQLGVSVDMRPEDLMLSCVRSAAGRLQYAQQQLAQPGVAADNGNGSPSFEFVMHDVALQGAAKISKMALDAGIAERKLRLAQAMGAMIATAFEAALADAGIDPRERQALVARFEGRLLALEQGEGDGAIEGTVA
jgi:hypothetical protein